MRVGDPQKPNQIPISRLNMISILRQVARVMVKNIIFIMKILYKPFRFFSSNFKEVLFSFCAAKIMCPAVLPFKKLHQIVINPIAFHNYTTFLLILMVGGRGFEPLYFSATASRTAMSANSTIRPQRQDFSCQIFI